MSSFFENLGRKLGRAAGPALTKTRWVWNGLTGTEEEALQAERDLGKTLATELHFATEIVNDPVKLNLIRGICRQLQQAVRQEGFHYHCELMEAAHPSAIALPGGYLFVSRSLVEFCEGQADELAFVIAHETAHVILRHTWDRLIQQSALRAVSFVTGQSGFLATWLRQQGLPMMRSAHSMEHEFEADRDGFSLIRAAGYSPQGALAFLQRIERLAADTEEMGEYFASHPLPGERIVRLAK